jgi:hypothetical protein
MTAIKDSNRLPILADEIRRAHADARAAAAWSIAKAKEAGALLIEAKKLVPHGGWLPWLKEHCALSERSAQRYMHLVNFKSDTVSDLARSELMWRLSDFENAIPNATLAELKYISDRCSEMLAPKVRRLVGADDDGGAL